MADKTRYWLDRVAAKKAAARMLSYSETVHIAGKALCQAEDRNRFPGGGEWNGNPTSDENVVLNMGPAHPRYSEVGAQGEERKKQFADVEWWVKAHFGEVRGYSGGIGGLAPPLEYKPLWEPSAGIGDRRFHPDYVEQGRLTEALAEENAVSEFNACRENRARASISRVAPPMKPVGGGYYPANSVHFSEPDMPPDSGGASILPSQVPIKPIPKLTLLKYMKELQKEGAAVPAADPLVQEIEKAFPQYRVTRTDVRSVHQEVFGKLPPGKRRNSAG